MGVVVAGGCVPGLGGLMKTAISFQSGLPLHFFILFLAIFATSAGAATHYVAAGGGNEAPYTNWGMAAHSIQAAMDVAWCRPSK